MAGMKARNIGTGLHYRAAHLYPYYRDRYGFQRGDFPNAETISDRIVSLPLFPAMTEADQDRVIAAMDDLFRRT
jgi:dTDP-4-amino-4,6-dideoxygalactose transaminase